MTPLTVTRAQAKRLQKNLQAKKKTGGQMPQSFLCNHCRSVMCTDCRQIVEEYQELLEARTRALSAAQGQVERLEQELARERRRADLYDQVAKAGLPAVITAWMDQEIGKLVAVKEDTNA